MLSYKNQANDTEGFALLQFQGVSLFIIFYHSVAKFQCRYPLEMILLDFCDILYIYKKTDEFD